MIEIITPNFEEKVSVDVESFLKLLEKYRYNTIPKFISKINGVELDLDELLMNLK